MEKTESMQFLIELPGSKVKELHGSRLVAITDNEVAFAFHDNALGIINDVDNVLRVVCGEYVDRSKGESFETAYLATCLALLSMALGEITESDDLAVMKRAREIIKSFIGDNNLKDMI